MKIKFSNVVKLFLAGACFVAVGCSDYGQDISNLNDRVNALETNKITPLETDLAAVKADLAAAKTNLQTKINENTAAINGLTEALATAKNSINATIEGINANIAALDKEIADLKSQDAKFAADITDLKTAIENLKAKDAAFEEHVKAYEVFVQLVETKLAALEGEVEALKAKDEELSSLIAAIDERVAKNAQDIADNKTLLDATIETLNLLQDAHLALATKVTGLEEAFAKYQQDIRKELDAHFAAFSAYTAQTDAALAELVANHAAQQILIEANAKAIEDTKGELAQAKKDLEASIEATNKTIEDYKVEVAGIVKKLEGSIEKNSNAIKVNADAITALQGAVEKLSAKVDGIEADLAALTAEVNNVIKKDIEALQGDLSALKGRIQSLVFVPDHADGAATIKWAKLGQAIVEAQSVLNFQVYPAECANALKNAEELKFVFTEALATTRGAAPVLNVVNVAPVEGKEGVIAVTVNARNLGADFYNGSVKYAASLVLETKDVNIGSCYVNLAPATADVIDVTLINDTAAQEKIEYTDLEKVVTVLPEHKYNFTVNGEGAYTIEGMLEAGYDIVVEKGEPTYEFNAPGLLPDVFKTVVDYTNPYLNYVNVSLAEATKEAVGGVKTVKYSYNVCGKTLTASATVRVVKIQRAMEWKGADIVWNYEEDAYSDAGAITSSKDIATIVASNLPEDVTYENLLAVTPTITVSVDGAETKDVVAIFGGNNNKPMIALENFEWNKTYTIVAVYELSSIDVTITATVNTIDRVRDGIVIKLAPEQWTLTKDFSLKSETVAEDLTVVYDMLVANKVNTTKKAAEFLKDIFINHAYNNDYNTANKAELNITKLAINDQDGATIKSVYSIEEFETIPESVEYVYTVNTWYGQKITFTKTLNIGLKPVEITLAEETVNLVKDLQFVTEAEKLAEIYDLVTNVDKANIAAEQYLKSIFVDYALRSQVDLANGVALANTKLVVNAENGTSATAAYNYVDFEATPEAVVYKSTYTTWYGQVITINKVVNIDWTTYNYVHIPEWVYNNDGYYSNALASYVEKQPSLFEEIIISLDMDTAFKVVDKAGVTINDLKALGLTSKFGFAVDPVDSRIQFLSGSNNLYYHGHDLTVGVKGQLILKNSNGVETVLPTNFDKGQIYADYYVKQYNPVGKLTSANLEIPIAPIAKKYTYYAMNQLSLNDKRPGVEANLIEKGELVKNDDNFVTWSNAAWVIGDGSNNFAVGVNAKDIYGLKVTKFSCTGIPEDMKQLYFDTDNGMLYFDNTNQIELTTPIILKVKVDITHQWANDSAEFTVTLYNKK